MRNIFAETLYKCAKKDKRIHIVTADISPAGSMESFRNNYPDRFINVGVAEQAMIGVAAGLAMRKKKPFAYTIATFSLYRPFEMIRDDICYQNLPVTIVGMGAGTIYANLGGTHLTQEDISIAKSLPNMKIICPCDPLELKEAVKFCATKNKSPTYLRIGKSGEANLTKNSNEKWVFGKIRNLVKGSKICLISYGPIMKMSYEIKEELNLINSFPSIYSCHTIKPLDKKKIKKMFKEYKLIVCIEDHSCINGLASDLKSLAYENKYKGNILSYSLKDQFFHSYYNQKLLLQKHGIDQKGITKQIVKYLK